jgi:maltokinase
MDADPTAPESPAAPEGLAALIPPYLARQRWYAGRKDIGPDDVAIVATRELCSTAGGAHHLHWFVVEIDGVRYQLLVGERPDGEPAGFLNGHEDAFLGALEHSYFYDAALDTELALQLLPVVTAGIEYAARVRPISAEQSNTSLVFDDRIIVKFFRRLLDGPNPDVETTTALAKAGFGHVAAPIGRWRDSGVDYAFAQDFLAGGTDGWALAQTSLRDFYNVESAEPGDAGGDFAGESRRLGRVTAELHRTLADIWGADRRPLEGGGWSRLVDDVERRLVAAGPRIAGATGAGVAAGTAGLVARLRAVADPGPAARVHGDYHLGQVMRTDTGWYVLDFEGEPARPLEERLLPASPLKDVTGMLRSLDYAARFALGEAAVDDAPVDRAVAWEAHNRAAFLDGYTRAAGIGDLLPPPTDRALVMAAYELDKALYELDYEAAYRPAWVPIPAGAIARIVQRLTGGDPPESEA